MSSTSNNVVFTTDTASTIPSTITYSSSTSSNSPNHTILGNNNYAYKSLCIGNYQIVEDSNLSRLSIRDTTGKECLAIQNGTIMIGDKTIHEVVLDIIDMVNGTKPFTDLLVDPDQAKRELGKAIYERRHSK